MKTRVGFGFDVHQLKEGSDFFIGGVKVTHNKGAVGHSDADVLIHAICDALLGAAAMGDIGKHFPDTDMAYKGIDSKELLKHVCLLLEKEKYQIGNIDCTICLQLPQILPYIEEMRSVLSVILKIEVSDVSIKATTTERLGYVGREEGVSAYAVALIEKAS